VRKIVLPGTSATVSRFIFGTASLFNIGSPDERARVLDAAYDHGLTHFDTAPLYGFGWAERDLAALLRRRPGASVTTKVGIYSPGGEKQSRAMVFARKAAGRLLKPLSRAQHDWSLTRAQASLDASLRRLGRDHVEIYMLHEPTAGCFASDEWQRWLEDEVRRGRIGAFGLALDEKRLSGFLDPPHPLATLVQTVDSLDLREADALVAATGHMQITYGYVSGAMARSGDSIDVPALLRGALARNAQGAVIVSSRRADRMRQFADIAEASA
jgi:aryl-alcohol dehydrogenase-like predicted oxidoreductase